MTADRINALLRNAPVFDGHNDLAWEMRVRAFYDSGAFDFTTDLSETGLHTDLERLRKGGVGAQYWSVYVSGDLPPETHVAATLEQIDFVRRWVAEHPNRLTLAVSADEVEAARLADKVACLMGMEGGHSIGCSLGALRMFYELGARYLTLTHIRNTPWADSATDEPAVGGLSAFGHEVVREMNRLGMIVDLSHVAPVTMHAALDTSTAPAFFSHSSARALCDHPRNVPDDVLSRVRDTDGVVMVTFVPWFLSDGWAQWLDALVTEEKRIAVDHPVYGAEHSRARLAWVRANPGPPCGVELVADHIEHVRAVAGVGAVGLGGDFDGIPVAPTGLEDVAGYPRLLAELADRGWSDSDLAALTWGNALRVLRDTEAAARVARSERGPSLARFTDLDGVDAPFEEELDGFDHVG